MSLYSRNSAHVPGTDICCSLIVTGRKFCFPVDFSASKYLFLTSSPTKANQFAIDQAHFLSVCRLIANEMIIHHRAMYCELINAHRGNPRIFEVGDRVSSRCTVRLDKKIGIVAKVHNLYTGPWEVIRKELGSSYKLQHVVTKRLDKRHTVHVSPFLIQLLPFEQVDGPDNQYGQIHMPMKKDPCIEARMKGFKPYQPCVELPSLKALIIMSGGCKFPSLAKPNDEL